MKKILKNFDEVTEIRVDINGYKSFLNQKIKDLLITPINRRKKLNNWNTSFNSLIMIKNILPMKYTQIKKIVFFLFLLISNVHLYAQNEFKIDKIATVKTPDATAFESINFFPVNEYTGRTKVNIPNYTIDLDGISIPISISYNTGGVKVNTTSSRVGLNWNLNAGGLISRDVKGDDDFARNAESGDGCTAYTRAGWINRIINYTNPTLIQPSGLDREPDIFLVSAPGFSTQFTHNTDGTPFEITPTSSIIENYFNDPVKRFETMKITNSNGIEYTFSDREWNWVGFALYNSNDGPHQEISGNSWDSNTDINEAFNLMNTYSIYYQINNTLSALNLSSINNPITGRSVTYEYDDNYLLDYNRRIERDFKINGNFNSQTDYRHDLSLEKVLKKITFPQGTIDFIYNNERDDLVGAKRLIRIDVKDNNNKIIKRANFVQDYFTSIDNCTDPQCLRLRLKEIYFTDKNYVALPSYYFDYNSTKLPRRFSYKQDFMGYSNGVNVSSGYLYKPINYKKANQGRYSYIPFNTSGLGYQALPGNYSLESNLTYSKAAILEKITYPTGGYATFNYELNSFEFLGGEISGGGLRISSHKLYNSDNSLEREIDYNYLKGDGTTSGSILFVPRYFKGYDLSNYDLITQTTSNPYELTGSSYVGYSRVKIQESGNGYVINQYSSPQIEPNVYPNNYTIPPHGYSVVYSDYIVDGFANGTLPEIFQENEIKRGRLLTSQIFDESNSLLRDIVNDYSYKSFGEITTGKAYSIVYPGDVCDLLGEAYALFSSKIVSERYMLNKTTQRDFLSGGELRTETFLTYDANKPFLKEKRMVIANQTQTQKIEKRFYPYDTEVSSLPYMSNLVALNRISDLVKTEIYENVNLLNVGLTEYGNFGTNQIMPSIQKFAKGSNGLEDRLSYLNYDSVGNPLEVSIKEGSTTVYIWGYNQSKLIAKIENASYSDISSQVSNLQNLSDLDIDFTTEETLRTALNNLRNLSVLSNSLVTTYTYNPLVGVTSITDPSGYTLYYDYDDFNRLIYIKDKNEKILKSFAYNYNGVIVPKFTVSKVIDGGSGSVSISPTTVDQGGSCTVTLAPSSGYEVDYVKVGTTSYPVLNNTVIISNIVSDIVVNVKFKSITQVTFTVNPTWLSYDYLGIDKTVLVTASGSWTVTKSQLWITTSVTSGSGSGSFTIKPLVNSGSARTGKVTVTNGGTSILITVSQGASGGGIQ